MDKTVWHDIELPNDVSEMLDKYAITADGIVDEYGKQITAQPPPPVIFHYTDDVGLKGILETGRLWLTDIFNLNDPSELRHGVSHAADLLKEAASNGADVHKAFASMFADLFPTTISDGLDGFVCAFSVNGDELGQWRAYADNGCGYALGFEAQTLENRFAKLNGKPIDRHMAFPVNYDESVLAKIHGELIKAMYDLITLPSRSKLDGPQQKQYMFRLSLELGLRVVRASLLFKHRAYKSEEEYRFFKLFSGVGQDPAAKRRYRAYEMVRYVDFDWKSITPESLRKIIVGPAADQMKAARYAKDCLAAFHSGSVDIECSRIPYRVVR